MKTKASVILVFLLCLCIVTAKQGPTKQSATATVSVDTKTTPSLNDANKKSSKKNVTEKFVFSKAPIDEIADQKKKEKLLVLEKEAAKQEIILSGTVKPEDLPKNYKQNFRKYLYKRSTTKKALKAREEE